MIIEPFIEELLYRDFGILGFKESLRDLLSIDNAFPPSKLDELRKKGIGFDRFKITYLTNIPDLQGNVSRQEIFARVKDSEDFLVITQNSRDNTAPKYSARVEFSADTIRDLISPKPA